MTAPSVHLDTDVGEGFGAWTIGDDNALLDHVSAANVACGFHAGDPDIIRRVTASAAARGVSVGAQVSYRDLAGFGRRFIDVAPATLVNDIVYQIAALQGFARIAGTTVSYVKAHGALYNVTADHEAQASSIVEAVLLVDPALPLLCQFDTVMWRQAASAGITVIPEVFADRGYTRAGRLVPRSTPGALVADPSEAALRVLAMVTHGTVTSVDGVRAVVVPDDAISVAVCVHSDTPGAPNIARQTALLLADNDLRIVPIDGGR